MENTVMVTTEPNTTTTAASRKDIELTPGRILPGGIFEINPMPVESEMHPDDRMHPIGA